MKLLAWMLALVLTSAVYGQETRKGNLGTPGIALLKKAGELFTQGKYNATITELAEVEARLKAQAGVSKETLGLIAYWKGISYARNQDFAEAIKSFDEALNLSYSPEDLPYEYGQVLFAAERLEDARLQFRESVKRKFKRAVCLYYIGFISKELGERKKAFTFFRAIERLKDDEAKEVRQAAEMQIGDIYLDQVEKHPDAFRAVETYVIPQYEKALELNPESPLAPKLREKITELQRKYDLVLFQLRNGRPTLVPPYFLRLALEYGRDSNVTFSPNNTTVAKSKQSSLYGRTSAMGRYTYYVDDYFSVSPELTFMYTRYFNRVPEIYKNDNMFLGPSLRTAYEHSLWKKPASFLVDYDYTELKRDVNQRQQLDFNSRAHGLMIGERFNYFMRGESIVRLRLRTSDSYLDSSDSTTKGVSFEQVIGMTTSTLLFFSSYDMLRMRDSSFDTNSLTLRGDWILSKYWGLTPTVGLMLISTDPINNPDRGSELLINPNARFTRTFSKHWRGTLKLDYQEYRSDDEASFAFKKNLVAFELEYLF